MLACMHVCIHVSTYSVGTNNAFYVLLLALQFEVVYCDDVQLLQCAEQSALL